MLQESFTTRLRYVVESERDDVIDTDATEGLVEVWKAADRNTVDGPGGLVSVSTGIVRVVEFRESASRRTLITEHEQDVLFAGNGRDSLAERVALSKRVRVVVEKNIPTTSAP